MPGWKCIIVNQLLCHNHASYIAYSDSRYSCEATGRLDISAADTEAIIGALAGVLPAFPEDAKQASRWHRWQWGATEPMAQASGVTNSLAWVANPQ